MQFWQGGTYTYMCIWANGWQKSRNHFWSWYAIKKNVNKNNVSVIQNCSLTKSLYGELPDHVC